MNSCERFIGNRNNERGSVLILVVWMISLMSILAAGLGSRGAFALTVGQRLMQQLRESFIATAAIGDVVHVLATDSTPSYDGLADEWANQEGLFENQPVGAEGSWTIQYTDSEQGQTIFGLIDEERKFNLTTVPAAAFQRLLEQVGGMKEDDAKVVADALADWRDPDKDPHPDGAEDVYYLGLGQAYECKDGPFENLEEVLLLRGMRPDVFVKIAPYLTAHGSGKVNLNTAPKPVLRALGLSDAGVDGLLSYRAGEDNVLGTSDDRALASVTSVTGELANYVPQEDLNRLVAQADVLAGQSEAFRFLVSARTPEQPHALQAQGVVMRSGQVTEWTEQ